MISMVNEPELMLAQSPVILALYVKIHGIFYCGQVIVKFIPKFIVIVVSNGDTEQFVFHILTFVGGKSISSPTPCS